ncbi:DUF6950 family protein [Sphingomonas melonis]|uniref:DUF6950 family protein n=1 Tax=Sphingomonas melonis TaxID=152682 RepID=UPI00036F490C|nr:hypothetical protein [Sphingomonas melonis]
MVDLAARVLATEQVVARFRNRPFGWATRRTCIHLARAQGRALGHRLPAIPDFRSPRGARTALRSQGCETLDQLLDKLFPRIAPLSAWVGDLVVMAGSDGFDGIGIVAGGKILGYHEDHLADGLVNIVPVGADAFIGAWRL